MDFLTSLDNYNIFYEVAKCGNITKASEKLFISQPAVSQTIKKMEENLGVALIIRGKKGIELTPIGKKVFEKAEIALHNLSAIDQLIDEEKGLLRGELIIGAGSNIARKVLCKPISEFALDYPMINIKIVQNVQTIMMDLLRRGELNFVLTQHNEQFKYPFEPLFDAQYCFVKSVDCDVEKFITITEGSYMHMKFNEFIEQNHLQDVPTMQVSGYNTALDLAKLGMGVTLVPRYMVEDELKNNVLVETYTDYQLPKIQFGVYYNPNLIMPAGKIFLEYLKD